MTSIFLGRFYEHSQTTQVKFNINMIGTMWCHYGYEVTVNFKNKERLGVGVIYINKKNIFFLIGG